MKATKLSSIKRRWSSAYDRWAPVYDLVFGPIFQRGRQAAIEAAERIGGRILEVGIGTGISLRRLFAEEQDRRHRYLRIDAGKGEARASSEMRPDAMSKQLAVMDASDSTSRITPSMWSWRNMSSPPFRDPRQTLDEFARVLKPGGEIILVSRVSDETGLRRSIEHFVAPAARKLGWRTEFGWERYLAWVSRTPSIELVERRQMPPLRPFLAHPVPEKRPSSNKPKSPRPCNGRNAVAENSHAAIASRS